MASSLSISESVHRSRARSAPSSEAVDTNAVAVEDDSPDPKVNTGVPWLDELLEGVDSLVEHGVIYGDLHLKNVLVTPQSCPQRASKTRKTGGKLNVTNRMIVGGYDIG
ncbi:hypothetical protein BDP27DRAFT_764391 [Rhodocollybia butyracea]|uniref:Protein kinase domain-containing protein n=1 Tax=Rhodocollybia butyracea TaxID=206335 RepID=A0A9P5U7D4_9AGAR|nr:hypothetical protein BDP27DRAFT_764391 [Rhodocollybia butyracea]